jgi:hypothetical protein
MSCRVRQNQAESGRKPIGKERILKLLKIKGVFYAGMHPLNVRNIDLIFNLPFIHDWSSRLGSFTPRLSTMPE